MNHLALKKLLEAQMPGYTPGTTTAAEALAWLTTPSVTRSNGYRATTRSLMADLTDVNGQPDPAGAAAILDALNAEAAGNSVVRWTLDSLTPANGGIELGHPATLAQLDALQAGGVLTAAQVTALKALGLETVEPCRTVEVDPGDLSEQIVAYVMGMQ